MCWKNNFRREEVNENVIEFNQNIAWRIGSDGSDEATRTLPYILRMPRKHPTNQRPHSMNLNARFLIWFCFRFFLCIYTNATLFLFNRFSQQFSFYFPLWPSLSLLQSPHPPPSNFHHHNPITFRKLDQSPFRRGPMEPPLISDRVSQSPLTPSLLVRIPFFLSQQHQPRLLPVRFLLLINSFRIHHAHVPLLMQPRDYVFRHQRRKSKIFNR